ncbi:MAG: DUF1819 family protein [Bacteroidetes bacterium]|nr:DUF1819 family protein [Bacteroidota bacterium]
MVQTTKYIFSFTGASALIPESLIVVEEFIRLKDWDAVETSLIDKNLLNKVKHATFKREFREIKRRLVLLTDDQLYFLNLSSSDDTRAIILLALVKSYSYLRDFIVDVIRSKYLLFETVLTDADYNRFFNSKCLTHPELTALADVTAKKVKQLIFKLLEQVRLLSQVKDGTIIRLMLSDSVVELIIKDDPTLLTVFLYSNEEIKMILKKYNYV